MGLPVTVYRYTDAGAPQLTNGTPSEWINILKKVLVEGYGSKSPLGWTLEFENAGSFKVAFRNSLANGGSGGYVQFSSASGGNAADTSLLMKCAIGMTAIDTFFKGFWQRALVNGSEYRGWEIIGTSRSFYLILHKTSDLKNQYLGFTQDFQTYFIGDVHSHLTNDTGCFAIAADGSSATDQTSSQGIIGLNYNCMVQLYATDASNNSLFYKARQYSFFKGSTSLINDAESLGIDHVMMPTPIYADISQNDSSITPFSRGVLPGLYISSFAGYSNQNWPKELTFNGVKWLLLRSYYSPQFWINTGNWYD